MPLFEIVYRQIVHSKDPYLTADPVRNAVLEDQIPNSVHPDEVWSGPQQVALRIVTTNEVAVRKLEC
jgi:hypothetical protein